MTEYKLAIFDMDGTLLKGRTIFIIAEKMGFYNDLNRIINSNVHFYEKSIEIAKSLKDISSNILLEIFRTIPLQDNVKCVIDEMKKKDIKIAIATDSYQFLADDLKNRLGFDYAFANKLIINKGIVSGELVIHNKELISESNKFNIYSINKGLILNLLCDELDIPPVRVIAIGDGIVDISMIKKAGLGIAFKAPEIVRKYADISIDNMDELLIYL